MSGKILHYFFKELHSLTDKVKHFGVSNFIYNQYNHTKCGLPHFNLRLSVSVGVDLYYTLFKNNFKLSLSGVFL